MKRLLWLIIILFASMGAYSQSKPYIENTNAVYEEFKYQPALVHTFEITNTGDKPLEILNAKPT